MRRAVLEAGRLALALGLAGCANDGGGAPEVLDAAPAALVDAAPDARPRCGATIETACVIDVDLEVLLPLQPGKRVIYALRVPFTSSYTLVVRPGSDELPLGYTLVPEPATCDPAALTYNCLVGAGSLDLHDGADDHVLEVDSHVWVTADGWRTGGVIRFRIAEDRP